MEWLEPWWSTAEEDRDFHETFEGQLRLEVGPDHKLFDIPARLIGRHGGSDDTLFELLDGSGRVAVVHLTWSKCREDKPWPRHWIYENVEDFAKRHMRPDHEDYMAD